MTLFIILWLYGSVAAYLLFKYTITMDGSTWMVSDRRLGIFVSLSCSWLAVVVGIILIASDMWGDDRPAKW